MHTSKIDAKGKNKYSMNRGAFRMVPGVWYDISERIELNTVSNVEYKSDGKLILALNGQEVIRSSNLTFRTTNSVKIDAVFFSTFFGGGDRTWSTPVETFSYFKDFVVTTPILAPTSAPISTIIPISFPTPTTSSSTISPMQPTKSPISMSNSNTSNSLRLNSWYYLYVAIIAQLVFAFCD